MYCLIVKSQKRGSKKIFVIGGIFLIALLVTSVLMTASNNLEITGNKEDKKPDSTLSSSVPESAYNYVKDFASNNGIPSEDIDSVTQVDFNSLPKEVNIENINDANLAIYQINYTKPSGAQDKIFMIAYSVEQLQAQGDLIIAQDKRELLNFGFNGKMTSGFLNSATGVQSGTDNGYVMMREGSITGISTNLEALNGKGEVELVIYKNGEQVEFGNSFIVDSSGSKKDYDTQSKGTVAFKPGDVISAYVLSNSEIELENVVTLIEITTNT